VPIRHSARSTPATVIAASEPLGRASTATGSQLDPLVEGSSDPVLGGVGVQTVHEQQAGNQLVGGQSVEDVVVEGAGVVHHLEQPLESSTVEVDDDPDQLLGAFPGNRTG
jgi:hypothetical protein